MDEFRPDHIPGRAVRVLKTPADAGLHFGFHVPHRLIDRTPERLQDVLVATQGVKEGNRLGNRESEVVADSTVRTRPDRQRLARPWIKVVTKSFEREFVDRPFQPEPGGSLASPRPDQFLSLTVIVRSRVIAFGTFSTVLLRNADHA